jgi:enoyl-CoA hydratase/carnithine racemase
MTYQYLRYEEPAPHVVRLVLDRPHMANALNAGLMEELHDALTRIAADDDVRVWLLTGSPRSDGRPWFSSGVDMKEALAGAPPAAVSGMALTDLIDDMLKPSIAVIAGVCTTGGLELVLSCDLRIAAESAQLSDWHMKRSGLGLGAWGLAARLSRLVGVDKAKELLLLSEVVDGREAARIGLVNRAVADEQLMETAVDIAVRIAAMPRRGVRATLGYLALQADMSKREAIRLADLTPDLMGLTLRPFEDAAARFFAAARADGQVPETPAGG